MKEFLLPYGKEKLTAKIEDEHLAGVLLSELHSYKAPKSGAELVQDALELVAVISAAIAAATGSSTDGFVVRSIKRR